MEHFLSKKFEAEGNVLVGTVPDGESFTAKNLPVYGPKAIIEMSSQYKFFVDLNRF